MHNHRTIYNILRGSYLNGKNAEKKLNEVKKTVTESHFLWSRRHFPRPDNHRQWRELGLSETSRHETLRCIQIGLTKNKLGIELFRAVNPGLKTRMCLKYICKTKKRLIRIWSCLYVSCVCDKGWSDTYRKLQKTWKRSLEVVPLFSITLNYT